MGISTGIGLGGVRVASDADLSTNPGRSGSAANISRTTSGQLGSAAGW